MGTMGCIQECHACISKGLPRLFWWKKKKYGGKITGQRVIRLYSCSFHLHYLHLIRTSFPPPFYFFFKKKKPKTKEVTARLLTFFSWWNNFWQIKRKKKKSLSHIHGSFRHFTKITCLVTLTKIEYKRLFIFFSTREIGLQYAFSFVHETGISRSL